MQYYEIIFRSDGIPHYITTYAENQEEARKWWMSRYSNSSNELEVIRQASGILRNKPTSNHQSMIYSLLESLTRILTKII